MNSPIQAEYHHGRCDDIAEFDLYDRNREGMDWKDWKESYGVRNRTNDDEGYTLADPDYQFYTRKGDQIGYGSKCRNCSKRYKSYSNQQYYYDNNY